MFAPASPEGPGRGDHRRRHRHRPGDREAARIARRADRDREPRLRESRDGLRRARAKPGIDALAIQLDVRKPEQVDEMVERTVKHFGSLDILVNNAAGNFICRAEDLSPNGWNAVIGIVLNGSFYCSRAVGRYMIARKRGGSIVSILANYVWTGSPGTIHSAAAKAGVMSMTQTLAVEWAPHGIRVNAVAPGPIESPGRREAVVEHAGGRRSHHQHGAAAAGGARPRKSPTPSPSSPRRSRDYITGEVLTIDGGARLGGGTFGFVIISRS